MFLSKKRERERAMRVFWRIKQQQKKTNLKQLTYEKERENETKQKSTVQKIRQLYFTWLEWDGYLLLLLIIFFHSINKKLLKKNNFFLNHINKIKSNVNKNKSKASIFF